MSNPPTSGAISSDSVNQISEFDLQRPPSCIQFLPGLHYMNHLVVGTYQLEPDDVGVELTDAGSKVIPSTSGELGLREQYRNGSLSLIKYVNNQLVMVDTLECASAVYDLHFLPEDSTTFAAASSTGTISFYHVRDSIRYAQGVGNISETKIQPLWSAQVFSQTTIITFFEFIPAKPGQYGPLIAATANDGGMYLMTYCLDKFVIDLLNDGMPITEHKFLGSPDYVWCCASYFDQTFNLFSGADGGGLIQKIIPSSNCQLQLDKSTTKVHDFHEAGVTAILPLPINAPDTPALILTGSYDEHVRLYSVNESKVLAKLKLGGGVYRLKYARQYHWYGGKVSYTILACCMHAGTKILQVQPTPWGEWRIEVVASLSVPSNNADNYCYAGDVQPSGPMVAENELTSYKRVCVSGTFVDKKLSLWEFNFRVLKDSQIN